MPKAILSMHDYKDLSTISIETFPLGPSFKRTIVGKP